MTLPQAIYCWQRKKAKTRRLEREAREARYEEMQAAHVVMDLMEMPK